MLDAVEQLLKDAIGLDSRTAGLSVLRHALKERMTATGIDDLHNYWDVVTGSRIELQQLINAVIVPETWFFRDREAFSGMARLARAEFGARRPIRMLSLPCSTGEEAYTMAMAMFDAGYGADDFVIEARDVSSRNLEQAALALYGRNSFRGSDLSFRDRYFEAVEDGLYRPDAAVRGRVRFRLANLFDPPDPAELASFDIVFCRNLLIYFDRETQDRALARLDALLAPCGVLLVAPAEAALPSASGFVSAQLPMAFAFQRGAAPKPVLAPRAPLPPAPRPVAGPKPSALPSPKPSSSPDVRPVAATRSLTGTAPAAGPRLQARDVPAPGDKAESLAAIERAANSGRLADARDAALAHLAHFGPSAEGFYHLALVQDAEGNRAEAIQNYRKVLYLAPDHREALAQLALLLQGQGDGAGAKLLNSRLGRMANRSST